MKPHLGFAAALGLAMVAGVAPAIEAAAKDTKAAHAKTTAAKHAKTTGTKNVPLPRPRPSAAARVRTAVDSPIPVPRAAAPVRASAASIGSVDISDLKEAITLALHGKTSRATEIQRSMHDSAARKLIEWVILRDDDSEADFSRYAAFIAANPDWPSIGFLCRKAEALLWQEPASPSTVRAFFSKHPPRSAKGRFALARALIAQGDRAGARAQVRQAWRNDNFSAKLEEQVLETFPGFLTAADHKARMDMRLYAEDIAGALRAAPRAGGDAPAIARARIAVIKKAHNSKAMLDAVPAVEQHHDIGLIFSRVQWLRRADKPAEAGALILSLPHDRSQAIDTDQWWIERRLVSRKLLDIGDYKSAYLVARDAVTPERKNYRIEHEFTAGWIALRFLNDPRTAQAHFMRMAVGVRNPISLARAGYWQGRAAEAMGHLAEARAHYQAAARYPTAYYGQLARARLGLKTMPLRTPPERPGAEKLDVVRAVELLYAADEKSLAATLAASLGDASNDAATLTAVGEITTRHKDARATALLGRLALGRGLPLERFAFPTMGIPDYKPIGPHVDRSLVYAIARQESSFNQKTVSSAKAMGLLQVTPAAGRDTAKKFGVKYNGKRLLSDPVYNVQMGSAELGGLLQDYRGSYILTFAGYNAGRGRVRQWIAAYGDPRDPNVDPIDWVERIPFSETRNYVQRVMENMQVYRVRLGHGAKLLIEADLHRGATPN